MCTISVARHMCRMRETQYIIWINTPLLEGVIHCSEDDKPMHDPSGSIDTQHSDETRPYREPSMQNRIGPSSSSDVFYYAEECQPKLYRGARRSGTLCHIDKYLPRVFRDNIPSSASMIHYYEKGQHSRSQKLDRHAGCI